MLKDSMILVYPGDDLYPAKPNPYETAHDTQKYQDKTYEELARECKNVCRIEMRDMFARNFMCNVSDGFLDVKVTDDQMPSKL
jgi:hypothetical protein